MNTPHRAHQAPAIASTSQKLMWIPTALFTTVGSPRWKWTWKKNVVMSQPAIYVPSAQNAT